MDKATEEKEELVETPLHPLDEISEINEIIFHREGVLNDLRMTLANVQARISSERSQWSQHQSDEERKIVLKSQESDDLWYHRLQEVETLKEQVTQSLRSQRQLEKEAEHHAAEIILKEGQLANLNQERLEIETLRRQVDIKHDQVETQRSANLAALTRGQDALADAEKLRDDVQQRILVLNALEGQLTVQKRDQDMREKQLIIAGQELDKRLGGQPQTEETHAGTLGRSIEGGEVAGGGGPAAPVDSIPDRPSREAPEGHGSGGDPQGA